jgi:CRP-like cAMP-binding protein
VQLAISDVRNIDHRLLTFFRHLGDRGGRMTSSGMHLPLRMTHELIAELVGAKRPTVTTALGELERSDPLVRLPDRTWLVRRPADDPVAAAVGGGRRTWATRRGGSP